MSNPIKFNGKGDIELNDLIKAIEERYENVIKSKLPFHVQIKLQNILKERIRFSIIVTSREKELAEYLYNGYSIDKEGTIKRCTSMVLVGPEYVRVGYNQNGKILYTPEIFKRDEIIVIHQTIKHQGVCNALKFVAISNKIIIYKGGK